MTQSYLNLQLLELQEGNYSATKTDLQSEALSYRQQAMLSIYV